MDGTARRKEAAGMHFWGCSGRRSMIQSPRLAASLTGARTAEFAATVLAASGASRQTVVPLPQPVMVTESSDQNGQRGED